MTARILGSETVRFRLETTDLNGTPIDEVTVGDDFLLRVFVSDVSSAPSGVFSPYLDITFDPSAVSPDGELVFPDNVAFPDDLPGKFDTPGVIDEVGAIISIDPVGGVEVLVFSTRFTANMIPGVNGTVDGKLTT